MKIYNITNQKDFTTKLFVSECFDNFLVTEADFVTICGLYIDGRVPSKDDAADDYVSWGKIRPLALSIIKGKDLPQSFKIVLKLSKENLVATLNALGIKEDTGSYGLYLNVRYESGKLSLVTGTAFTGFSLDRSFESGWDGFISKFLAKHEIDFEEA